MADSTTTNLDKVVSAAEAVAKLSATALAQAIGLWTAARTAIETVAGGVAAAATMKTISKANAQYMGVPLTPAVLADMVIRNILAGGPGVTSSTSGATGGPLLGNVDGNTAVAEAALSGLDPERFNALVQDTGESYGIIDALRLYNRGLTMSALTPGPNYSTGTPLYVAGENLAGTYGITEAELKTVIYYSRVRDQFVPDLLKLAKNSLSAADAVELAVKQIVDTATARSLFEAAGGVGEQFQALVDAAGDSAGIEKAVSLFAHGVINEGQLRQVLALTRINPRFYYLYLPNENGTVPANHRYLGAYEVGEALTNGTIDAATALEWLVEEGYPADQAAAFATAKATTTLATPKAETASQLLKEYAAGMYTKAEVTTALEALGYTPASVPFLLQYATASAIITARNSAVGRVKASYLVGETTEAVARTDLGALGIPSAAITAYLADWAVELATPHAHLSAAQVGKLLEDGYIDVPKAQAKWQAMGYSAGDSALLLYIYPPPAPTGTTPPPAGSPGTPAATGG